MDELFRGYRFRRTVTYWISRVRQCQQWALNGSAEQTHNCFNSLELRCNHIYLPAMKLAILKLFLLYAIACASALTCGNIGDDISIEPGELKEIHLRNKNSKIILVTQGSQEILKLILVTTFFFVNRRCYLFDSR